MSHTEAVQSRRATTDSRAVTFEPKDSVGMAPRAAALGIDVAAFVLAAPFVLGILAVVLQEYWAVGAVAIVAAYTIVAWAACGQTFGMSIAGIELVDERTRRCASLPQVIMRSALTLPPLVGGTILLNDLLVPASTSLPEPAMLVAMAATAVGVLSALWAVVDQGRMLHDRLAGVLVVRKAGVPRRAAARG